MKWTRAGAGSLVAAAIAAFVYALTLAPSVGAGDSGELILAAHSMGIPHPPGYPLWVLLARCVDLLPWGTTALRVNALSAVLTACAAGLFHALARRCGLDRLGRIAATVTFAGSTLAWAVAGFSVVFLLPLRSGANPVLDWGHDQSLAALWDNLLRRNYGGLRQNGYSLSLSIDEVVAMAGLAATSLGGIGTALAGVGAFAPRRARAALLPLTLAALTIPAALAGIVAFTPDAEHLAQIGPFLIPVTPVVALW